MSAPREARIVPAATANEESGRGRIRTLVRRHLLRKHRHLPAEAGRPPLATLVTDAAGFEPATSGLGGQCLIQARLRVQMSPAQTYLSGQRSDGPTGQGFDDWVGERVCQPPSAVPRRPPHSTASTAWSTSASSRCGARHGPSTTVEPTLSPSSFFGSLTGLAASKQAWPQATHFAARPDHRPGQPSLASLAP